MEPNAYYCAVCGTPHETIENRVACETKCLADAKKKAELMKLKKEAEAREKSEKAALDALDVAENALKEYFKEYERLAINKSYPYLKLVFGNKTWWF